MNGVTFYKIFVLVVANDFIAIAVHEVDKLLHEFRCHIVLRTLKFSGKTPFGDWSRHIGAAQDQKIALVCAAE